MAPEVRNCRRCGKIFVYVGVPVCEDCLKKEEEQYAKVKRYLDEHPRAGVRETSEATDVPAEVIVEFVRRGILITSSRSGENHVLCAICGKPISSGRVCPKCETALISATGKMPSVRTQKVDSAPGDDNRRSRMYSIDMIVRKKP